MNTAAGHITADEAADRHWDAIVIGAGMGGGLAGRRLAEQGLSVLFVEKGPGGHRSEEQDLRDDLADPAARQLRGFWPAPIEIDIDGTPVRFFAPLGSGVGGSSTFYAAALERPERHDMESVPGLPHPTGGWPVGYDAFAPYFDQAAELLSVRGLADPLSDRPAPALPPPPLRNAETVLFDDLRALGLHPYRAHEAMRRVPGCTDCLGRKCPMRCKMDGRSAGVEPALETGHARLLTGCSVDRLDDAEGRVTGLRARADGRTLTLTADAYVLAAGALHSPRLLLASTQPDGTGGANSSGWVGRGLMFHLNEIFALWPRRGSPPVGATRTVSFRDFYTQDGKRLGLVQSMGVTADAGRISSYLKSVIARSWLRRIPGVDHGATLAATFGARLFGNATVFVGLMEDLPYFENRVTSHPRDADVPVIAYTIADELSARRLLFRRRLRKTFGWRRMLLLGFQPTLNYGHPSGTLRFGRDPDASVLDADCRAHDLGNLFVADASFMPSSMGVNPSLTIAANALRVADVIAAEHAAANRKAS